MNAQPVGAHAAVAAARRAARALLGAAAPAPPRRRLADAPAADTTKQVVVQGSGEERVRVRRARLEDGPRALHLVRRQLQGAPLPPAARLIVADLVDQTLAQGHSLVAEAGGGGSASEALCGLALCASLWPWDAEQLERQACCIRCTRSRRLLQLVAQCLRVPPLHRKYTVDALFQVTLVMPDESAERATAARLLAARALQRAAHLDYPLVRFDVSDSDLGKMLEEMRLCKELEIRFELDKETGVVSKRIADPTTHSCANFVAVYCAKLTASQAL